jgi:Ca2+-binding EF-hand superfamily protein
VAYKIAKPVTSTTIKATIAVTKPVLNTTTSVTNAASASLSAVTGSINKTMDMAELKLFTDVPDAERSGRRLFAALDSDNDNLISQPELEEIGSVAEVNLGADMIAILMEELEVDRGHVDFDYFYSWWRSDSDVAMQLQYESRFAVDQDKAANLRQQRSQLTSEGTEKAYEQEAAWQTTKDAGITTEEMTGRVVKHDEKGVGTVEEIDAKGALKVNFEGKTSAVKSAKRVVVANDGYIQDFVREFVTKAMRDILEASDTDTSDTDTAGEETAVEQDSNAEEEVELEEEGGKKKKSKKVEKDDADAEIEKEVVEEEPLDVQGGRMTRDDITQLGELMGIRLTKTELDKAMSEMDPTGK